jgi:hypothetical protein
MKAKQPPHLGRFLLERCTRRIECATASMTLSSRATRVIGVLVLFVAVVALPGIVWGLF